MGLRDAVNDRAAAGALEDATVEFDAVDDDAVDADVYDDQPAAGGSILDSVRARAQELQAEQTVDLALPGYREELWARYRAVSLSKALNDGREQNPILPRWTMGADILARALVNLYVRTDDGKLCPVDPPQRYDDELADLFGLTVTERNARAVLRALLGGGELGESRVWTHYMAYQGWLMAGGDDDATPVQEVAEAAVGEYLGR